VLGAPRPLVLVVDDQESLLEMTARYLRAKGFDVITSTSSLGIGALVLRHHPAAVVLDLMMPALDGEALARLLRGQRSTSGVAIVLHSAAPRDQVASAAARCGAAAFVMKGDGLAALHAAIRAALGAVASR
jgi:DNA-binding response OmpR family regulator